MISFVYPIFLWGLLGLAIPVGIHLLSRKEGPLIRIGSLRHIRETNTRQFKSIRLNEVLLLMVRCLLVALIVLFMSGTFADILKDDKKWLILEKGLDKEASVIVLMDSVKLSGYEIHFLAPGFPNLGDREQVDDTPPDYVGRLEELNDLGLDSAIVVSYSKAAGFTGKRIQLPSFVRWISKDAEPVQFEVNRTQLPGDSVSFRFANSSPGQTAFDTRRIVATNRAARPDTVTILIGYDSNFAQDKRTLVAVLTTIQQTVAEIIVVKALANPFARPTQRYDWMFWLSESNPPDFGDKIVFYEEQPGFSLLEQQDGSSYQLTSHINQELVIRQKFVLRLMDVLFPSVEERRLINTKEVRSMDQKQWLPVHSSEPQVSTAIIANDSTSRYLLLAILVVVILERLIAYRRQQ